MTNVQGTQSRPLFMNPQLDSAPWRVIAHPACEHFASFEGNNGRELVPFFDQQEIHGMSDWRQRILQGLRESRLLLACLFSGVSPERVLRVGVC